MSKYFCEIEARQFEFDRYINRKEMKQGSPVEANCRILDSIICCNRIEKIIRKEMKVNIQFLSTLLAKLELLRKMRKN